MKVVARRERFDAAGARVVFVSHDRPEAIRRIMLRDVALPYPLAVDRERDAYRTWGLATVPLPQVVLDPGVWRQYARLMAAGERLRRSGGDVRQLGGDFVVGGDGRIAYARPQRRDDRPPVGELLNAVAALA